MTLCYPKTKLVSPAQHHMTQITWRQKCEISCDESHYSRKPGNWVTLIIEKIMTCLGTSESGISEKNDQKFDFIFLLDFFPIKQSPRFSDFPWLIDMGQFLNEHFYCCNYHKLNFKLINVCFESLDVFYLKTITRVPGNRSRDLNHCKI